jgi:hypothetical protein
MKNRTAKMTWLALAASAALAAATPASATTYSIGTFGETASAGNPAPAGSTGLGPGGAVGGIGGPISFVSPVSGLLTMTVTDCCLVGDVYQAFVNGASLGFTSPALIGSGPLSSGVFTVGISAGTNTFDINDQILSYLGVIGPYDSINVVPTSYSPAGLTVDLSVTSAPGPVPGAGLAGFAALALAGFYARTRRA